MNFLKNKLQNLIAKYTLERKEKINLLQGRILSHLTMQNGGVFVMLNFLYFLNLEMMA
jgi:hypothetical protein